MTWHLHGCVLTAHGTAANNRGENAGNIAQLQKLLWKGSVHTTVSAEAIRWALRYWWQIHAKDKPALVTNRQWNPDRDDHTWQDTTWSAWSGEGVTFIDDDVLGFMNAQAAKSDGSDADSVPDSTPGKKKPTGKRKSGTIDKRRGALEVTRAVSLLPYAGDITFNAKSGNKTSTSVYGAEMHATRYQFGFSLTPEHLREPRRVLDVVDALVSLGEVAGNHARFLYDFSPDAVVFRWTHDPAPRLLYCFDEGSEPPSFSELLRRVRSRDVDAAELIVGGSLESTSDGNALVGLGATVLSGVKGAAAQVSQRMRDMLGSK